MDVVNKEPLSSISYGLGACKHLPKVAQSCKYACVRLHRLHSGPAGTLVEDAVFGHDCLELIGY